MTLRQRLGRLWAYERAVVIISFWLAVIFFVTALVWVNIVSLFRDTQTVGFIEAGLWFIRSLMLCVLMGTLLNVVGFAISLILDAVRRVR